ncbi:hypothetical protein ACFP9V_20245 [Deinococcus radiopugnans]|uniref:Uncharacterized protein n=1 Tax=Deinococcus radiopugnans ATCC 19172 TaxID=585398 RepID=A0A5C4YBJ5_9DEIO|nr:hypothetical protein [Deinococcus radiopugnans]MBB6015385.1 hypothetical protein [Deinococcus radiopugnans ATCC 19172]TNM72927.1 hypothetical protein FHR04_00400 [Deinococcus radiopugnans ATCC 19172]
MSSSAPVSSLSKSQLRGAASSILISAVFALIWGINGSLALPGGWSVLALGVVLLVTAALAWLVRTLGRRVPHAPVGPDSPGPNPFTTTAYRVSLGAMIVAFPLTARLLTANGWEQAIMAAAVIIVGLHFIGLIFAFRNGIFAWVAGAFCLLGGASLLLPAAVRTPLLGLGCALILWLGVTPLALRTLQSSRQAAQG